MSNGKDKKQRDEEEVKGANSVVSSDSNNIVGGVRLNAKFKEY